MKLIYIDPFTQELEVRDCKDKKSIKKVLTDEGLDEDNCSDMIQYVFTDNKGNVTKGELDFT